MPPNGDPRLRIDIAMPRWRTEKVSATSEWLMGLQPPSPRPTPARKIAIWTKLVAKPQRDVIADHSVTATASNRGRETRSAMRATGRPASAWKRAKAGPLIRPSCQSLSRRSALIGSCSSDTMLRSR
jgi:hypothetical protein